MRRQFQDKRKQRNVPISRLTTGHRFVTGLDSAPPAIGFRRSNAVRDRAGHNRLGNAVAGWRIFFVDKFTNIIYRIIVLTRCVMGAYTDL